MSLISVTPTAIENIKRLQEEFELPEGGLRFGLTGGGCSGYKYVLELEDSPDPEDQILEFDGIKVFLNPEHADKLKNSVIDWEDSLMESGFKIDNPQAKRPCGCGTSFDIVTDSAAAATTK